jgi:hypothetical protein
MGKRFFLLCLFLISGFTCLIAQNSVSFFEEHIDFSLDSTYFSINGIYSFYNNSNETAHKKILFPFAIKENTIDSIKVIDLNTLKILEYSCIENAISFDIILQPKDTLDINIFYRQKTLKKNTYILTSTQLWENPLNKAIYTLTIPAKMTIISFSYIPDSTKVVDDKRLYIWQKYHFMPKFDFDLVIDKSE